MMISVLLFVVLCGFVASQSSDPCTAALVSDQFLFRTDVPWLSFAEIFDTLGFEGASGAPTYYQVRSVSQFYACMANFPFNATNAKLTIDALIGQAAYYVFLQENKDSPPPFDLKADLIAQLNQTRSMTFQTDWDFYAQLVAVYRTMKDGHTRFLPPSGFLLSSPIQPIMLRGVYNGPQKDLRYYVAGDASVGVHDYVFPPRGNAPYIAELFNYEVLEIDGFPVGQYLRNLAQNVMPLGKPIATNFETVLQLSFNFPAFPPTFPARGGDQLTFTLRNPATNKQISYAANILVAVPVVNGALPDTPLITQANQFVQPSCPYSSERLSLNKRSSGMFLGKARSELAAKRAHDDFAIIVMDEETGFSLSVFKNTSLILRLPDFEGGSTENFWQMAMQFIALRGKNYDRLLIDVRFNTGGDVCLGVALAAFLCDDVDPFADLNLHDFRKTPLLSAGLPPVDVFPVYLANATSVNDPVYSIADLFAMPDQVYFRGNQSGNFTPKFKLQCAPYNFANVSPFPKKKVTVLTNSVAVSTAATFLKTIRGRLHVVGVGGDPMQLIHSRSFSIGNPVSLNSNFLYQVFACFNETAASTFPFLPSSATFACPFAEAYEFDRSDEVAEYVQDDVDQYIPIFDYTDMSYLYDQVLNISDSHRR